MGTIIRAVAAYMFLLVVLRVAGRRGTGGMTPTELIVIFLIGGLSVQAIVVDDRSLVNAFLAMASIGLTHYVVTWLKKRFPRFGALADGTPILLIDRGHMHPERMDAMHIAEQDLASAARQAGVPSLDKVGYAVVERNGSISIIPADSEV